LKPVILAAHYFLPEQTIDRLEPFGTGNVNDTFRVILPGNKPFILQRVNPSVFPDPQLVQHNIRIVTEHLQQRLDQVPELRGLFIPLFLYKGKNGYSYQDRGGGVWRLVNQIPGQNLETVSTATQAEELGRCLGLFHRLLSSLEPAKLADTLPGFHHTPAYLDLYEQVHLQQKDSDGEIEDCHRFIEDRRALATLLVNTPKLSRGIIHGDPKVANFVFAADSGKVVSLIDLDTVRYGLLLHDIGDALRSCCNPLGENLPTPEQVNFAGDLFRAWLLGYLREGGLLLTETDKTHIVDAVRVITFELGLRFFTDHLAGDRYFKVLYPGHNLFRAQVQFRLVRSIEEQREQLKHILKDILA